MNKQTQTRPRLLAMAIVALALLLGGLAGATIDRAIFRPAGYAASPGHAGSIPAETTSPGNHASDPTGSFPPADRARHRERMHAPEDRAPGMPMRLRPRDRYLDQLTRELELSADQRAQIEALLQRQQERMRALRQEERQRSGAVVAETRAGLFEILTPEQRVTLQRSGRPQARGRGS